MTEDSGKTCEEEMIRLAEEKEREEREQKIQEFWLYLSQDFYSPNSSSSRDMFSAMHCPTTATDGRQDT